MARRRVVGALFLALVVGVLALLSLRRSEDERTSRGSGAGESVPFGSERDGAPLEADEADEADEKGRPGSAAVVVRDVDGGPVRRATVTIQRLHQDWRTEAKTNNEGRARTTVPATGIYRIGARARGFATSWIRALLPGDAAIVLRRGTALMVELSPFPDPAWTGTEIYLSAPGESRTVAADRREIDAGRWLEGPVRLSMLAGENQVTRRLVALPEGGEVRVVLRAPAKWPVRVRLHRGTPAGPVITDWQAFSAPTMPGASSRWLSMARRAVGGGVYELAIPAARPLLSFTAPTLSREYFALAAEGHRTKPWTIALSIPAALEVQAKSAPAGSRWRVDYLGPATAAARNSPGDTRAGFMPVAITGGVGHSIDLPKNERVFPPAALLAETAAREGRPTRIEGLPARSRVRLTLLFDDRVVAWAEVRTGDPGATTSLQLPVPTPWGTTLKIVTPKNRPARGVFVLLQESRDGMAAAKGSAVTNSEGQVRIAGLAQGRTYVVWLQVGAIRQMVRLDEAGSSPLRIRLARSKTRVAEAIVLDARGRPVPGALVTFMCANGPSTAALTDRTGTARARIPLHARVTVACEPPGGGDVLARLQGEGRVEIRLPTPSAKLRIRIVEVVPARDLNIEIWSVKRMVWRQSIFVDRRGVVPVPNLPAGDLEVRLGDGGETWSKRDIHLQPGVDSAVDISPPR